MQRNPVLVLWATALTGLLLPPVTTCSSRKTEEETCTANYVRTESALELLKEKTKTEYFGQQVALKAVLPTLYGHLVDENATKPLVFSFHGGMGSGKSYLAQLICQSIFLNGEDSKFVKYYHGSTDFHDKDQESVKQYKKQIQNDIVNYLTRCDRSVFVFDEVDHMPPTLVDALFSYFDGVNVHQKLNQKNAIYILLSNTGAEAINRITVQALRGDGRTRDELTFKDFRTALLMHAFNYQNVEGQDKGMKDAIIKGALIDLYVPFLPMEEEQIAQCAEAEMRRRGLEPKESIIDAVVEDMLYDEDNFSKAGCKPVHLLVHLHWNREKVEIRALSVMLPILTGIAWYLGKLQIVLKFINRQAWLIRTGVYCLVFLFLICFLRNYFSVVRTEVSRLVESGRLDEQCELPDFPQVVPHLVMSNGGGVGGDGKNTECHLENIFLSTERLYDAVELTTDQFVDGGQQVFSLMKKCGSVLKNGGGWWSKCIKPIVKYIGLK